MDRGTNVDPKRIVAVFFLAVTVFCGVFLEKILGLVFSYARLNDPAIFGEGWTLTTLIGFGVALVAGLVAWRNDRLHGVSMDIAHELRKVTWPTLKETRAATVAVVVATFAAAVVLGAFDYLWASLSDLVY